MIHQMAKKLNLIKLWVLGNQHNNKIIETAEAAEAAEAAEWAIFWFSEYERLVK